MSNKNKNSENEEQEFPEFESHTMRFLGKYFPWLVVTFFRWLNKSKIEQAEIFHKILHKSERIDLVPYRGGGRGFIIIMDQKTALYFNQDGDKFVYDGWEVGEYEKGDVTIFDDLKK